MPTTIELAGQRFPACAVICPPRDGFLDETEFERSLGSGGNDHTLYIPAENGLLFELDPGEQGRHPGGLWDLWLCARACFKAYDPEGFIWLPQGVHLFGGDLQHQQADHWNRMGSFWIGAEEDWLAETIQRLAHKPFVQPPGPEVKLVPADYFADQHV